MDPTSLKSAGWTPLETGGFSGLIGPFWMRGAGADRVIGFIAESRHGNNHLGTVHGGALMTFADISLGYAVVNALGGANCVPVQLQTQFVSSARMGEFITCRAELVRHSSQLVFMRGLISAGDRTVASADGIWKVLKPK